jgi:hypothetical protein
MWNSSGRKSVSVFTRTVILVFGGGAALLPQTGCQFGHIGGTYVAYGPNFASLLQLTQSSGGQITGTFDEVVLGGDGRLYPTRTPVIGGTLDGNQLTLTIQPCLFGTNISGNLTWTGIHLHGVGTNGDALSWDYHPSSSSEFKAYADDLKSKAEGTVLNAALLRNSQQMKQTIKSAEMWISSAEKHARKLPGVKEYYRNLEDQMRLLVAKERSTPDSVSRSQMFVAVNQKSVVGTQADLEVGQTWDRTIVDTGRNLKNKLVRPVDCDRRKEFKKRGATSETIDVWERACQQLDAERAEFEVAFTKIMQERVNLKNFQTSAESRREALVADAGRFQ